MKACRIMSSLAMMWVNMEINRMLPTRRPTALNQTSKLVNEIEQTHWPKESKAMKCLSYTTCILSVKSLDF
jgi:hypothetical protein